jgi:hypothetical protein
MADVYINIAWIFEAPTERSKKFIEFGLGQEKLFIEHQKKNILENGSDPEKNDYIKALEGWVDSQCLMFLVEVNIGSWSEMTTRQMAQEANCLDFYRFVYSPFSSGTHSTWQQIAKYNLVQCANPLHKHHLIPHYYNRNENTWDYSYFSNALKYLEKSYRLFDEKTGVKVNAKSSYDFFTKEANCFLSELEKTRVAKD